MLEVFTNAATESSGGAKIGGMMNPDGSLGTHSREIILAGAMADIHLSNNGGALAANVNTSGPFTVIDGKYFGQRLTIRWVGAATTTDTVTISKLSNSALRSAASGRIESMVGSNIDVTVRGGEVWELFWSISAAGRWSVHSNFIYPSGPNYRTEPDGTITVFGASPFNAAGFPAFATLPLIVDDGTNFIGMGGEF